MAYTFWEAAGIHQRFPEFEPKVDIDASISSILGLSGNLSLMQRPRGITQVSNSDMFVRSRGIPLGIVAVAL
jgi:hypothetical protein